MMKNINPQVEGPLECGALWDCRLFALLTQNVPCDRVPLCSAPWREMTLPSESWVCMLQDFMSEPEALGPTTETAGTTDSVF